MIYIYIIESNSNQKQPYTLRRTKSDYFPFEKYPTIDIAVLNVYV